MTTLFSYTVACDSGAAPNPFHGMCTLAICKPGIRRVARPGDWVVGIGSRNAPQGNLGGHVVYAMCVERCISMAEYDLQREHWPHRVPTFDSTDPQSRLGDCIYDYSHGAPPRQRPGMHDSGNVENDLGGRNVLLSHDFYYFGANAIALPMHLLALQHGRGHKSVANAPYVDAFVSWIRTLPPGRHGEPGVRLNWEDVNVETTGTQRCGASTSKAAKSRDVSRATTNCADTRRSPSRTTKGCAG